MSNAKKHAAVTDDDGVNYREIAELMTTLGYPMRHSSARNHIITIMKKFVFAFCDAHGITITDAKCDMIAKTPEFQAAIADVIWNIETRRRMTRES